MSWRAGGDGDGADAVLGRLARFRCELYLSLGMRRDVLFEACDAAPCKQGRMLMLAGLCLEPECRRGHGAVHNALNCGEVRVTRMRRAQARPPLPARPGRRRPLAPAAGQRPGPRPSASPRRPSCPSPRPADYFFLVTSEH